MIVERVRPRDAAAGLVDVLTDLLSACGGFPAFGRERIGDRERSSRRGGEWTPSSRGWRYVSCLDAVEW